MEIITYNIWDLPLWFVRNREKRVMEIAALLVERETNIICFQEAWTAKNRKVLSSFMKKNDYYDTTSQSGVKGINGGLLTFSKYPITSARFIPFGRWSTSVSEIIGNKGVLETIVETPKGLLRILNTHLHFQSSRFINTQKIRLRQLHVILNALKKELTLPTVLMGDFNEHTMMESPLGTLLLKNGFTHEGASDVLHPTYRKENHLVDNWINRMARSERYDYILTKDISLLGLSVKSNEPLYIKPALSDHDPVVLTLT